MKIVMPENCKAEDFPDIVAPILELLEPCELGLTMVPTAPSAMGRVVFEVVDKVTQEEFTPNLGLQKKLLRTFPNIKIEY